MCLFRAKRLIRCARNGDEPEEAHKTHCPSFGSFGTYCTDMSSQHLFRSHFLAQWNRKTHIEGMSRLVVFLTVRGHFQLQNDRETRRERSGCADNQLGAPMHANKPLPPPFLINVQIEKVNSIRVETILRRVLCVLLVMVPLLFRSSTQYLRPKKGMLLDGEENGRRRRGEGKDDDDKVISEVI